MNGNQKKTLTIAAMIGGSLSPGLRDRRTAGFPRTSNATSNLEHLQAVRVGRLDYAKADCWGVGIGRPKSN
jgi:hypothetical protein